jgi:outer membrane protein TolC
MARTQLLPQLNFTEDISRGNDPVYAFGTRLRQRQFTQADFALNALNFPSRLATSPRASPARGWHSTRSRRRGRFTAPIFSRKRLLIRQGVDQQIVFRVVGRTSQVLYAQREIDVAQHEQETAAALLTSVEDHVKAGLAVESDRMSAQVNVAARKEELIAAQGDLELAWAELREAMGAPELKASELKPIEPHTFPQGSAGRGDGDSRKDAARSDGAGAGAIGAGVGGGSGKVGLRPSRERLRKLGRRPHIVCRLGRQQLGGRRADQRRHSALWQARPACAGERRETEDRCASGCLATASAARK